jgi:hypothetical protein
VYPTSAGCCSNSGIYQAELPVTVAYTRRKTCTTAEPGAVPVAYSRQGSWGWEGLVDLHNSRDGMLICSEGGGGVIRP